MRYPMSRNKSSAERLIHEIRRGFVDNMGETLIREDSCDT
jgi:hypothetical protein